MNKLKYLLIKFFNHDSAYPMTLAAIVFTASAVWLYCRYML